MNDGTYKSMRLLIDADMFAYLACQKTEDDVCWGGDVYSRFTSLEKAFFEYQDMVNDAIDAALSEMKQTVKIFPCHCFSDPRGYFRSEIYPTYKAGRAQTNKPVGYRALCERIAKDFRAIVWDKLEADDVIGILATRYPTESLIISGDKDLNTIPGPHYDFLRQEYKVVSEDEAAKNFLVQALAGDSTDGYGGCPSVGDKTARKIFEKNGWSWMSVVETYKSKGLTEADALMNARCAYILHDRDYNKDTGEVILWNP